MAARRDLRSKDVEYDQSADQQSECADRGQIDVRRNALLLLSALYAIGLRVSIAPAADLNHWSLCMSTTAPETSIKECSTIIDSGQELPASLPYAYLYRG